VLPDGTEQADRRDEEPEREHDHPHREKVTRDQSDDFLRP
jgi:hypothetical protein